MDPASATAFVEFVTANLELVVGGAAALPVVLAVLVSLLGGSAAPASDATVEEAPPPAVREEHEPSDVSAEPEALLDEQEAPPATEPVETQAEPAPAPESAAEPEHEPEPEPEHAPAAPPARLRDRLARTREGLIGRLGGMLGGRTVDDDLLEELEALLFTADLGVGTAEGLLGEVKSKARGKDGSAVREVLREAMLAKLRGVEPEGESLATTAKPHVVLVLGVNGSGKTTTIGKLAARYQRAGNKVVLGAGDTFRAAAIEQLQVWGERVGCDVIAGQAGGDPAAVAFDTVKAAVARGADVAIIDTAGRLQTKQPLMEELGKIARVLGRDVDGAPHETLLVLDSNTGQNALSQAKLFTEVTEVTGIALTKLDGTAKGGVIVGLADEFAIPVRYVGVGEGIEDLRDFQAEEFVDALFAQD